jgi:hypothetical protein
MQIDSNTALRRAPNIKVQIISEHEIAIYRNGQGMMAGSRGLALLDIFSQPTKVSEAIDKLAIDIRNPQEWLTAVNTINQLYRVGLLQDEDQYKSASKDKFRGTYFQCFLDQPSLNLLPYSSLNLRPFGDDPQNLIVSKGVYLQRGPEPPDDLTEHLSPCERFLPGYPLLWVQHPASQALAPYWLNDDYLQLVGRLIEGQLAPAEVTPSISEQLMRAHVLVPEGYEEIQINEWQEICASSAAQLQSEQYAVIRNLLHPLQIAALRQYFRALEHKDMLYPDVIQSTSLRYVMHNEEVARFVHRQITPTIERVVRESIKPSYCFLSVYKSGAYLPKHRDRPQCVWNLSLLIDTDPETDSSDSWPIYLEAGEGVREVRLGMGDGVLYRGTDLTHWREALPDGELATLIFCHFVPEDFTDSLE